MDESKKYPTLSRLFKAGFTQDYSEEFDSPSEVVALFSGSPVSAARIPGEVERFLAHHTEPNIDQDLFDMGLDYDFRGDGLTGRKFLSAVVEQFAREAPTVDPRYAPLLGEKVSAIDDADPPLVVVGPTRISFPPGFIAIGPKGSAVPPKPRTVEIAQDAVGEPVLSAFERDGQFTLATALVQITSMPDADPGFLVTGLGKPADESPD